MQSEIFSVLMIKHVLSFIAKSVGQFADSLNVCKDLNLCGERNIPIKGMRTLVTHMS